MKIKEKISDFVNDLIVEGEEVLNTEWARAGNWIGGAPRYVDLQKFKQWQASCNLLISLMGHLSNPWQKNFEFFDHK